MTDRPIIFSGPMVQALLAGRKTQTRRPLSPRNTLRDGYGWHREAPWDQHDWTRGWVDPGPSPAGNPGPYLKVPFREGETWHRIYPAVQPGDRLWVREAIVKTPVGIAYVADGAGHYGAGGKLPTTPSIHMPRWASRLTLTVTEVRVQRLQEISEADAEAEGCHGFLGKRSPHMGSAMMIQHAFASLWEHINGPGSWDANPWVAAISFTVEQRNIDQ